VNGGKVDVQQFDICQVEAELNVFYIEIGIRLWKFPQFLATIDQDIGNQLDLVSLITVG
jgi:hypothetical protein